MKARIIMLVEREIEVKMHSGYSGLKVAEERMESDLKRRLGPEYEVQHHWAEDVTMRSKGRR